MNGKKKLIADNPLYLSKKDDQIPVKIPKLDDACCQAYNQHRGFKRHYHPWETVKIEKLPDKANVAGWIVVSTGYDYSDDLLGL